jgi:hypothetical protein
MLLRWLHALLELFQQPLEFAVLQHSPNRVCQTVDHLTQLPLSPFEFPGLHIGLGELDEQVLLLNPSVCQMNWTRERIVTVGVS